MLLLTNYIIPKILDESTKDLKNMVLNIWFRVYVIHFLLFNISNQLVN